MSGATFLSPKPPTGLKHHKKERHETFVLMSVGIEVSANLKGTVYMELISRLWVCLFKMHTHQAKAKMLRPSFIEICRISISGQYCNAFLATYISLVSNCKITIFFQYGKIFFLHRFWHIITDYFLHKHSTEFVQTRHATSLHHCKIKFPFP